MSPQAVSAQRGDRKQDKQKPISYSQGPQRLQMGDVAGKATDAQKAGAAVGGPGDVVALDGPALGGAPGCSAGGRGREGSVLCWGTGVLKQEEGWGASLELLVGVLYWLFDFSLDIGQFSV